MRGVLPAVLTVIVSLVLAGPASAVSFHVRPDGNDGTCDGLVNAPDTGPAPGQARGPNPLGLSPCAFQSPQKGVDSAGSGDTVLIHAGTYTAPGTVVQGNTDIIGIESRTEFFSEPTRLVVRSAGDGPVVFDGQGLINSGITIWGTSYVTIEGITLQGFKADQPAAFEYGAAGVNVTSPGPGSPANRIILKSLVVTGSTTAHLTGLFAEIAIRCDSCANNTIESCTIDSVEPFAIAVGTPSAIAVEQRGVIRYNTITHLRDTQAWAGILGEHTNVWRIEGNYIDDAVDTIDPISDLIRVVDSNEWTIGNNVLFRPARNAIRMLDNDTDGTTVEFHEVLNNTIDCVSGVPPSPQGIRSEKCSSCQVRNNIVVGCASAIAIVNNNPSTQLGFNNFFDNTNDYNNQEFGFGHTLVGGDVSGDPLFTEALPRPDPFYRLMLGSPAIDAGDDANCFDVPPDGLCDMGAFQAAGGGGNQPPARPSIESVNQISATTALLHGSDFSDPDGDAHLASQWQVDLTTGDFSAPVKDSGRTTDDLESFKAKGLTSVTTYKSRVRYQDENETWSPWSDPAIDTADEFTTCVATALPPTVATVVPAAGTLNVVVTTDPTVTFNVPVEAASVTTATVRLTRSGTAVPQAGGSPALDGTEMVVTITPAVQLDSDTKYKIAVVGGNSGIQSRDCSVPGKSFSSTFTTEGPLASSNPANGATGVSTVVNPQLVFKWAVNAATATTTTVKLKDVTAGRSVALAAVNTVGATVTLVPAAPLVSNHKYRVTVVSGNAGLKFVAGSKLGKPVKVGFQTL